jgi:hypothetical protein
MGCSEKIDCRANGEIVFYWMIPLTSKDSKNVLPERLPQNLRMKKGGVEIELEILRDDLKSGKREKQRAVVETTRRIIFSPPHTHSV